MQYRATAHIREVRLYYRSNMSCPSCAHIFIHRFGAVRRDPHSKQAARIGCVYYRIMMELDASQCPSTNIPCLVLVPDTFIAIADTVGTNTNKRPSTTSLLVECIQDEFSEIPLEPVQRKYWNDDAGISSRECLICRVLIARVQACSLSVSYVRRTMNVPPRYFLCLASKDFCQ